MLKYTEIEDFIHDAKVEFASKTHIPAKKFHLVWANKSLSNYKALFMNHTKHYYEATYDGEADKLYLVSYKKEEKWTIESKQKKVFEPLLNWEIADYLMKHNIRVNELLARLINHQLIPIGPATNFAVKNGDKEQVLPTANLEDALTNNPEITDSEFDEQYLHLLELDNYVYYDKFQTYRN